MKTYFDDNLRVFDAEPAWASAYASAINGKRIYAETAFGAIYCVDTDGIIYLIDPEDREVISTDCNYSEFIDLITSDPGYYLDQQLYDDCCKAIGKPTLDQHFAYRHPLALGGAQSVENVILMDAGEHMRFLAGISSQIEGSAAGTSFHPIGS